MAYFKRVNNNYISVIFIRENPVDELDIAISKQEYDNILSAISNKPKDTDNMCYMLQDLTLNYLPVSREPIITPDAEPEEILSILLGGDSE